MHAPIHRIGCARLQSRAQPNACRTRPPTPSTGSACRCAKADSTIAMPSEPIGRLRYRLNMARCSAAPHLRREDLELLRLRRHLAELQHHPLRIGCTVECISHSHCSRGRCIGMPPT